MTDREQRARDQLEKKLTFEAAFRRGLVRDYVRMNTHFSAHFGSFGFIPGLSVHQGHFNRTLNRHLLEIQRAFKGDVVDELPERAVPIIDAGIEEWSAQRAGLVSSLIIGVAGRRINNAVRKAREAIEAPVKKPSVVARIARSILRPIFRRSAATTAATETQAAAEGSKNIVGETMAGKLPTTQPFIPLTPEEQIIMSKIWMDRMDDRVRPHHVDVRGQEVGFDEPFVVMGERLMFPGDRSLGASAGNVINCRCSTLFERQS